MNESGLGDVSARLLYAVSVVGSMRATGVSFDLTPDLLKDPVLQTL